VNAFNVPANNIIVVGASAGGIGPVRAEEMVIRDGCVFVARPDYHLIVDNGHARLSRGPREHRFRPAVDPLFRTAAKHYGKRAIGVVLSGHMADGTHGLRLIERAGGVAIVQDPDEAEVPSMPLNAMRRGEVDYVLPAAEMPRVALRTRMWRRAHG
jgi:two-component system chemotaxis response regulator CheB